MYHTVNEFENFRFDEAELYTVKLQGSQAVFELGYVTILPANTCNRDIREMGTNELILSLTGVENVEIIKEGYKLYDADGNLKNEFEDEVLDEKDYPSAMEEMENSQVYTIKKENDTYMFFIDGEEQSYVINVKATGDTEDWERFMNKNSQ